MIILASGVKLFSKGWELVIWPFEDTIYIDSAPVIEYKSGTDGFLYSIR